MLDPTWQRFRVQEDFNSQPWRALGLMGYSPWVPHKEGIITNPIRIPHM